MKYGKHGQKHEHHGKKGLFSMSETTTMGERAAHVITGGHKKK
jgi:hypothetical protein